MKKSVLFIAAAFAASTTFAQDLTSKKGEPYLPEAGDWAIQIDAAPFLTYFGGFFSNAGATAPTFNYQGAPWAIRGKMMKDETTAYRAGINISFGSNKQVALSTQDGQSDPNVTVEDEYKASGSTIVIAGGLEMRRGKTRLQGYYGADLMIGFGGSKDSYTYGNNFSSTNTAPTTNNFGSNIVGASRITEMKNGSTTMFGLRGFIGAEYFIFPKIAIGAEYGWGLGFSSTGQGSTTSETWDFANNAVKSTTTNTGKSSSFMVGTDLNKALGLSTASLTMTLYF